MIIEMKETITRTIDGGLALRESEGRRTISGYAIRFGVESAPMYEDGDEIIREVIAPGAVTDDTLSRSDIVFTMFHNDQIILARSDHGEGSLKCGVDDVGVHFEFAVPDTEQGRTAAVAIERGDIKGCSFQCPSPYVYDKDSIKKEQRDNGDGRMLTTFTLSRLDSLHDMTLTPFPAYPATSAEVRAIRSLCEAEVETPADIEPMAWEEDVKAMRDECRGLNVD